MFIKFISQFKRMSVTLGLHDKKLSTIIKTSNEEIYCGKTVFIPAAEFRGLKNDREH